ncbi:Monothiol glutaredoxin-S3 [Ranunculus cassubicifolius]
MDRISVLSQQKAVVIFSKRTCCMSHAVKRLFYELGVSPAIHELDEIPRGKEMEKSLVALGISPSVPMVFIGGGQLIGSTNTIMSIHLNGSLVPMLKQAGAMWL